jgi:periplasmic divalent cation tolerance protein
MFSAIYTTINDKEEARKIAYTLVHERICACVNIFEGVESVYKWMDKIEDAQEIVLLARTSEQHVKKAISRIQELHSYEVSDIIVFPIVDGSKNYLDCISRETV